MGSRLTLKYQSKLADEGSVASVLILKVYNLHMKKKLKTRFDLLLWVVLRMLNVRKYRERKITMTCLFASFHKLSPIELLLVLVYFFFRVFDAEKNYKSVCKWLRSILHKSGLHLNCLQISWLKRLCIKIYTKHCIWSYINLV